ncbi:MAG TPA: BamA/TamA family outer membrane protein [Chitinivibrionales bacterium]|jgi:outer membrane protein assembly factor BamA|nr:BamA/TamA family outer membrane protein [Chitinivibrionales bacterium]
MPCRLPRLARHVLLLLVIQLYAFPAAVKQASAPVQFSDSGHTYLVVESRDLATRLVLDRVQKAPPGAKAAVVRGLLDSLGFFLAVWDTVAPKTVHIDPGGRSRVDSVLVQGDAAVPLDSVAKVKLPFPYDAGYIQWLAGRTIYFLGCRGYPFASLSVSVRTIADFPAGPRTARRRSLSVVFDVRENGRCVFAKPLLIGKFKTGRKLLLHDVSIRENAPFSVRAVEESRERLLSRAYVTSVEVSSPAVVLDAALPSDTGGRAANVALPDKVMVPFSCSDKSGFGFEGALTFQAGGASLANTFYGVVNLSLLNIIHSGETVQLSYNGQQDLQRMELSLSKPYLLDFPVFASGDFGLEIRQDQYGYLHGSLEGLMELRAYWQFGLGVTAHEVQVSVDTAGSTSEFGGADIILVRNVNAYRAGELSRGFSLRSGSGIARNNGRQFDRWHVDMTGNLHVPLTKRWAVAGRFTGDALFSEAADSLNQAELYRVGGYNSLRGYADQEFAFKTVGFGQAECLFYYNPQGSIYLFADAGMGFGAADRPTLSSGTKLFGYGLGIRVPSKIGSAAIEWARNYQDTKSLGRVHVSVMNPISAGIGR